MNIDRQMYKLSLQSIVDSLDRIDGEREHIKEVAKVFEEKTEIPARHLKKIARLIQKSKAAEHRAELEEIDSLLETALNM